MNESDLVKLALSGDESAKERLFKRFEAMAKKLARPYVSKFGEDAISIGFLALWEGVMKFDPSKGMLSTVVYTQIRAKLLEEDRRRSPFTRNGVAKITEMPIREWDSYEIDMTDTIHTKNVFENLVGNLNGRERALMKHLLAGSPVSSWARTQGVSQVRGGQIAKRIREKAQPLIAA